MDELLLPLFPLEVVLLPEEVLPLHISEERYKRLISNYVRAQKENRVDEFGVVPFKHEDLHTVGCTARVTQVLRRYDDGRLDVLTAGARHFAILFTDDTGPCLKGVISFFDDDGEPAAAADEHQRLKQAVGAMEQLLRRSEFVRNARTKAGGNGHVGRMG